MGKFFASPAVQKTTGVRGKTTGQKRTKTVRGNEGAWIAQVKEELAAAGLLKPAVRESKAQKVAEREAERAKWAAERAKLVYEVKVETLYRGALQVGSGGRYETREAAEEAMNGFPIGPDRSFREVSCTRVWIEGPEAK